MAQRAYAGTRTKKKKAMGLQTCNAAPLYCQPAGNGNQSHGSETAVFHNGQRFFPGPLPEQAVGRVAEAVNMKSTCHGSQKNHVENCNHRSAPQQERQTVKYRQHQP